MNSKVFLLSVTFAVTLAVGQEIDHRKEDSGVKSQMQNIKEEKEFLGKLESKLGIKKGFPTLRDVPEEIKDALKNDALPEMVEKIEAHHDKAEAEIDDYLKDLEAPRSSGKADARPGWPCSRRRWWGSCGSRRRSVRRRSVRRRSVRRRSVRRRSVRRRFVRRRFVHHRFFRRRTIGRRFLRRRRFSKDMRQ